jgi:endonuclease YncB( thermonuclease family)
VKVVDSDNFRLQLSRWSKETFHLRLAGIDAPEGAHFGQPGQPYWDEAKSFLTNLVEGKRVEIRLLRRDQHGRAVCCAKIGRRDVSLEMVRHGWAVVYEGKGAEYGDCGKTVLEHYQKQAQKKKLGMWVQSKVETPMDYKRRIRAAGTNGNETKAKAD